jgi:hypothetical protein
MPGLPAGRRDQDQRRLGDLQRRKRRRVHLCAIDRQDAVALGKPGKQRRRILGDILHDAVRAQHHAQRTEAIAGNPGRRAHRGGQFTHLQPDRGCLVRGFEGQCQRQILGAATHAKGCHTVGLRGLDGKGEIAGVRQRLAVDGQNDVARQQAGCRRKPAAGRGIDQQPGRRHAQRRGHLAVDGSRRQPELGQRCQRLVDQALHDAVQIRGRYGIGNADEHPAAIRDLAVHAQKPALGIDQRPAGRARVHRSIMLHHLQRHRDFDLPGRGRDPSLGKCELDPEGGPQRIDLVAKPGRDRRGRKAPAGLTILARGKRDHRHIPRLIPGDHRSDDGLAVPVDQDHLLGVPHHMGVGDGHHRLVAPKEGRAEKALLGIVRPHHQHGIHCRFQRRIPCPGRRGNNCPRRNQKTRHNHRHQSHAHGADSGLDRKHLVLFLG